MSGLHNENAFFLSTAPPPLSFCRLQKENGGGKLPGFPGTPGRSTGLRHAVPRAWPPPTKFRPEIWGVGQVVVPYGRQLLLRCPKFFARMRSQNFDRCHSFLLASSATGGARKRPPLHKGAFRTGDADCRVASLLAMTVLNLCHSEEAQRADVGIRPFYDGRGFGPPSRRPLRVVAESRRNHPGSALSAEREAGQIRSLPDDLGVQHGVQGSEV